nr:GDSL-type esterase/lipase family protein [uncultured Draconibacterium sp.]
MKRKFLCSILSLLCIWKGYAQEANTTWDNTLDKSWPDGFEQVKVKSSLDGETQGAVIYKTIKKEPQPLIVSLHTWSGDYLQEDPLAKEVALHDWNYIHPDFRGPNNNPEACGSPEVVSNIEDAIHFAVQHGNVDTTEVHIIGVSGGGYATLLAFMKLDYPVKSFHAWAPVTNLEDWYWETKGRGLKYSHDLENVTTGGNGFDPVEARKRSPQLMTVPHDLRAQSTVHIYTGIHDGYTGSVPITHSVNMFNQLVKQLFPRWTDKMVSDSLKIVLLEKRLNPKSDTNLILGARKVHLFRELPGLSLAIFEGSHEMIVPQALALLPVYESVKKEKLTILTIGDSNGAAKDGWPVQLQKLLPYSTVLNRSVPGNTIGFDNLNNPKLNTIRNIGEYLASAMEDLPEDQQIDYILFGLGTNDAKNIFDNRQQEVAQHLDSLLVLTKTYFLNHHMQLPQLVIISPPPMNETIAIAKYDGGNKRIDQNNILFREVAKKHRALFIDTNTFFKVQNKAFTVDGVHLAAQAQFLVARIISEKLLPNSK